MLLITVKNIEETIKITVHDESNIFFSHLTEVTVKAFSKITIHEKKKRAISHFTKIPSQQQLLFKTSAICYQDVVYLRKEQHNQTNNNIRALLAFRFREGGEGRFIIKIMGMTGWENPK